MFGRSFKPAKCKTTLRLAISRIKLLKNKRDLQLKQTRRDLAQLLQSGQEPSARIRVEHVMREQNIIGAYEFLELFCEIIVARMPIIESQKNCPNDLLEAISSLIFAAPRCADIPELSEIRSHFGSKYGKEFVASAAELRPGCGVNRTIIEKLSARAPGGEEKLKIMKEIAKEHQIEWDPSGAEKDLFKPPEDLLNGPSKFVGATEIPTESKKESYKSVSGNMYETDSQATTKMPNSSGTSLSAEATHYMAPSMSKISEGSTTLDTPSIEDSQSEKRKRTDSSISSSNIEQRSIQAPASEKSLKATDLHQGNLEKRSSHSFSSVKRNTLTPRNTTGDKYDSSQQSASYRIDQSNASAASSNEPNVIGVSNSQEWNMNFKDVSSAARAAAYSAEMASEAAKAAAELSRHNTLQKKDSRKTRATTTSSSSSDGETMEQNNSRITRRPGSNEYVQPENQPLHGNDLSGRHYVESHSENANYHHSASWQSSQQKGTEEIDNEYPLPMKSTSRLESYQWPSDEVSDDDTVLSTRKSASVRREGIQHIDSEEEKPFAKKVSDFSNSVDGSSPWKTETATSHSNTRPSEVFYDSFNRKSESAKESEWKRSEYSRNTVTEFPLFDDPLHGMQSDIKWSPQNNEHASVGKSSTMDESQNHLYQSNPEFQPPMRPPPGVLESSKAHAQYSFANNNRPLNKVSTPPGSASYDSSSSDDDKSNSRIRGKPSSNDRDHSGWHLVETHEKNRKPQRKVYHQNEIANAGNEYNMSLERIVRTDLYHQPSNRVYDDGNKPFENKSQTFRREQEDQITSGGTNRQQTDIYKSAEEPLSRKGKTVASYSHQPSSRVYHDGNRTFENKSKPFRREQEDQINNGGTNRQQTDIRNSVEEPLSRKGSTKDSRSDTRASDIFNDFDSMASKSDEETELETHNANIINRHRRPLSSNSSHSTSSNSLHEDSRHTEKVSASPLSLVNETRVHLSQSNSQYQPPKQPLSGLTASSEASSQSPSSAGESKAQRENLSKRATHVHPKLPDYDDLAAKFASMKRQ